VDGASGMIGPSRAAAAGPPGMHPLARRDGSCVDPAAAAADGAGADGQWVFASLLWPGEPESAELHDRPDQATVSDLNLGQIVEAVAGDREQRDLITGLLYQQVRDPATIRYRHGVFRGLGDAELFQAAAQFAEQMRQVRVHLDQLTKMHSARQREGWFLDAAAIYCDAVRALVAGLNARAITSRGLTAFREYLAGYIASAGFARLSRETADRVRDLGAITYQVRIKGSRVEVSRYEGEPDYSAEIQKTFDRFRQGAVQDYLVQYRVWPGMTHVGAQIAELVARLYPEEFNALTAYCREHARFADPVIRQFDRELQFYLAYLEYIRPLRAAGLAFCYPDLAAGSKDIFACDTFGLALAAKLTAQGKPVVTNEFHLSGPERVIVVSGPNQGGKTTFARTFGQLHLLACTGCPVPGSAARLYLYDQLFTHFEQEEDLDDLTGKLEDDLLRIQKSLLAATPDSIVIMNEIFTSTTVADARFLGEKVLAKVIDLDLLCVYVTFIDELAAAGPTVVSMASTIVPGNPAERTYKVVRKQADGLAYALAIAARHGVTYDQLRERLRR
jgi:DNA mismatch repair protein MutS